MNKVTDGLHVVIKVLAGNQSPGAHKLLNHGEKGDDHTQTRRFSVPMAESRRRTLRSRTRLRI